MRTVLGSRLLKVLAAVLCTVALFCCAVFCYLNFFNNQNATSANAETTEETEETVTDAPATLADEPVTLADDITTIWNNAVQKSKDENSRVTVTLTSDWLSNATTKNFYESNVAGFSMGRIYVPAGADMVIDLNGHKIDRQLTASVEYGSVICVNGTLTLKDTVGSGMITGGFDSANSYYGGGVLVANGSTLYTSVKISGNTSKHGGGISLVNNCTVYVEGGSISQNTATSSCSGGIYMHGTNSRLYINSGSISYNNGGVYASGGSYMEMNGGSVSNNKHNDNGGVLLDLASTFVMNAGEVSNNENLKNLGYAGGIAARGGSEFTLNGGSVSGNICRVERMPYDEKASGGVLVEGRTAAGKMSLFIMNGGSISGNDTGTHGGGVGVFSARFVMNEGVISGNTHSLNNNGWSAAAIFLQDSKVRTTWTEADANFVMYGGSVSSNKSEQVGAIHTASNVYMIMRGGEFVSNSSGSHAGAILLWGDDSSGTSGIPASNVGGRLDVYGGSIRNNFSHGTGGGGVGVGNNCTFNMYGGEIINNSAIHHGGGVMGNYATATINLFGGVIAGNRANYSGVSSDVTYEGSTFKRASYFGSGVYTNNCKLTLGGSIQIYDNINGYGKFRDDLFIMKAWAKPKLDDAHPLTSAKIWLRLMEAPTLTAAAASTAADAYNVIENATATALGNKDLKTFFTSFGYLTPLSNSSLTLVKSTSGNTIQAINTAATVSALYWRVNDGTDYVFTNNYTTYLSTPYTGKTFTILATATATGTAPVAGFTVGTAKNAGTYTFSVNSSTTTYNNATFTLVIEKVELNVAWSGTEFTYSGNNIYSTPHLIGAVNGETPAFTQNRPAQSKNVGTYSMSVSLTAAAVNNNYTLNLGKASVTYKINPATISKPYSGGTMTYNGSSQLVVGGFNSAAMNITYNTASPARADDDVHGRNAGTYTATITLNNADALNYRWEDGTTSAVTVTSTINKATLSVTGISLASKPYDGTPNTTLSMDVQVLGVMASEYDGTEIDRAKIWVVPVGATAGAIALSGSDVGQYTKKITIELDGTEKGNYQLYSGEYECVCNITKAQIEVTGGIVVANGAGQDGSTITAGKVYDGNTNVVFNTSGVTFKDVSHDDAALVDANIGITASGAYSSADAGSAVVVNFYNLVLTGTNAKNYDLLVDNSITILGATVKGEIVAREVEITLSPVDCDYGSQPTINYTVTGAVAGDSVRLEFTFKDDGGNVVTGFMNAGDYSVIPALTAAFANNYSIKLDPLTGKAPEDTVTVNPKTVVASGISFDSKVYDGTTELDSSLLKTGYKISGLINGDTLTNVKLDIDTSASTFDTADVGYHSVTVTIALAGEGTDEAYKNYVLASTTVDVGVYITPAQLTITGVTAAKKSYDGTTSVTLTVAFSGIVNVDGTDDDVDIKADGAFADPNAKATADKTVNIHTYYLDGTAKGNYEIVASSRIASIATGEIEQKSVTVAITATNAVYGNIPAVSYAVTGAVAGDDIKVTLAYLNSANSETVLKNVGAYTITPTIAAPFDTNYKISGTPTGSVDITRAELTLAVNDMRVEYGATLPAMSFTVSGYKYQDATDAAVLAAVNAISCRYFANAASTTPLATDPTAAGEYIIKVYGANPSVNVGDNYKVVIANATAGKLVISGMSGILVTIASDSLVYGVYNSAYVINATVTEGGSASALTLADLGIKLVATGTVKNVGDYVLTYQVTDNNKYKNYDVTVLDGILTVTKAPLTITVGTNASRVYGTAASTITAAATATATGLITGDTVAKAELTFTTNYVQYNGVGYYDVFVSNWTDVVSGYNIADNYDITYVSGRVEITPLAITVTADDKSSVYGSALTTLTFTDTASAILNGDNLGIMLAVQPKAGETEVRNAGTYSITGSATNGNYTVTVTPGTYTITKATLTARPADAEIAYGSNLPLGVKLSGYKYADESDKALTSVLEDNHMYTFRYYEIDDDGGEVEITSSHDVEAGKTYYMTITLNGTHETDNYKVVIGLDGGNPVVGQFEVFGQALVVIINNVTAQYGKDVDLNATGANQYRVTDLNGVEQTGISDLDITLNVYADDATAATLNADGNYDVGKYLIIGTKNNNNYSIIFVDGNYTVTPYEVEVVWTLDGVDLADGDAAEFTYNGNKQGLGARDKNDGAITLTVSDGEINAGVYYAGVTLPGSNYIFKNASDVTRMFEIKQLELDVVWKAQTISGADIPAASGKFAIPYSAGNAQSPYPTFVLSSDGATEVTLTASEYFVKGGAVEYGLNYEAKVTLPTGNYKIVNNETAHFDITKLEATINWTVGSATGVSSSGNSCIYTYTGAAYSPKATSGELDLSDSQLHFTIFAVAGNVETLITAAVEVGTYRVRVSTSNNNYKLTTNNYYDFEIKAQEVEVTWSANSFTFNGLEQAPEAYFTYYTEIGNAATAVTVPLAVTVDGAHKDKGAYVAKIALPSANFALKSTSVKEYNYDITEKNIEIKWTLEGAELTVVEDKEEEYDGEEVETSLTALLKDGAGINPSDVPLKYSVTRRESATSPAVDWTGRAIKDYGIYTLSVTLDTASAAAKNYKVVDGSWQITVTKVQGVVITAEDLRYELNQLASDVPLKATVTGLVAGDKADTGTDLIDELINSADNTIVFNWLVSTYAKGTPIGTFADYNETIKLNSTNTAVYNKFKNLLKNYEWTFVPGSYEVVYNGTDVFFYLMFDRKSDVNFVYNGAGRLPKAYYVDGGVTKELKVKYVVGGAEVDDKPVDAGDYTVRIYKTEGDNTPIKDLDGTELTTYIDKQFSIIKREIYVNVSDGREAYGNVSLDNLDGKLEKYLIMDYVRGNAPAYADGVGGDRDDLKFKLVSYKPAADKYDILLNVTENFVNVGEYYLAGDWDKATFGNNYNVTFEYANGDHMVYGVEEAKIYVKQNGTQWAEEWFDEAQLFDRYKNQFITLDKQTVAGTYDNIVFSGNMNAKVNIYYSNRAFDMATENIPEPTDEALNGYTALLMPLTTAGKFAINFKIEIDNHETLFGRWTVLILPEGNYVKVLFVKDYTVSYGDEPLDREALGAALVDGGYLEIKGMKADYFKAHSYAYVPLGNGKFADGTTKIGQYTITFELHDVDDESTKFEIMYREDVTEPDTNIGRYVIEKRLITVEWGETSYEYDGEAHIPEVTLNGWVNAGSVKLENIVADGKQLTEVNDNGVRTVVTVTANGDFKTADKAHRLTVELDNANYRIEATNASNAVSVRMPEPDPVYAIPSWVWYAVGGAAAVVALIILILAVKLKKRKGVVVGAADNEGFYDDYQE